MSRSTSSRLARLQQARRMMMRRLAAGGAVATIAIGVAAFTVLGVVQAPDRALALMESLPNGAFGLYAVAPAAQPATGDEKLAADAPTDSLPARAVKRAAAPLPWKSANCSTYGIGDGLLGSGLAGGGKLRSDSMIVAHKTLPFGTKIVFSYHGRTCTAVVRDRGPYVGDRVFDLGPGVAKQLGFGGVGHVQYVIASK